MSQPRDGKKSLAGTSSLGGMAGPAHPPGMGLSFTKLGFWPDAWPSGVCVGLLCKKFALFFGPGGQNLGRVLGVAP